MVQISLLSAKKKRSPLTDLYGQLPPLLPLPAMGAQPNADSTSPPAFYQNISLREINAKLAVI